MDTLRALDAYGHWLTVRPEGQGWPSSSPTARVGVGARSTLPPRGPDYDPARLGPRIHALLSELGRDDPTAAVVLSLIAVHRLSVRQLTRRYALPSRRTRRAYVRGVAWLTRALEQGNARSAARFP